MPQARKYDMNETDETYYEATHHIFITFVN